jgi:hypothetical protein
MIGVYERGYSGQRRGKGYPTPDRWILINLAVALDRPPDEALGFFGEPALSDQERAELGRRAPSGPQRELERLHEYWSQLTPELRASILETLRIAAQVRHDDEPPSEPTALAVYSFPARVSNRGRRPATRTAASG